jgi:hypothetical protein
LVPEIDVEEDPWFREEGRSKYLVGGLRIVRDDSGAVERADQRFPSGSVQAMTLPERFGGGYLFYQADTQGTRVWRSQDWTSKLVPLSTIGMSATEMVAGFDRLYLRTKANKLVALDPDSGRVLPLGPLPPAPSYGAMTFADGWRAVVDTELRGPMATFDAGATWRPLGVKERVIAAAVRDGDPILYVDGGYYLIRPVTCSRCGATRRRARRSCPTKPRKRRSSTTSIPSGIVRCAPRWSTASPMVRARRWWCTAARSCA